METISSLSSEPITPEITKNLSENKGFSSPPPESKTSSRKRRLEDNEDSLTGQDSDQTIAEMSVGSPVVVGSETAPPLSKATNKKRRLEEDISTEQISGKAVAGASTGSSVLVDISETLGRELTLLNREDSHLDNEPSGLDSSGEVEVRVDDDTGDSSISSIAAAVPVTSTTLPLISPPNPTPVLHATSVQVSAPVANSSVERSSGNTVLDPIFPPPPLAEVHIEESDADTRPSKKARLDIEPATNPVPTSSLTPGSTEPLAVVLADTNITLQTNVLPKPSPFVALPVELLSEILIYTGSSQHVLAVARTCKALCQTLLSTTNQFIWRMARRAGAIDLVVGPVYLPDPPQDFFGEAAYAAFVFDSGACEVCGKETNMMYTSFALRARLCKNVQCRNSACGSLSLFLPTNKVITDIIPLVEASPYKDFCRLSDLQNASAWVENAPRDDAFRRKYARARARNIRWMEFAVSVHQWSDIRQAEYYAIRNFNETQSRIFANKFGWDRSDMINNTVYRYYHKQKNKVMERVQEIDVRVMVDQIESQLLALSERRDRHAADVALLKNRSDIEKYYNSVRSSKVHPILPSLPTFHHLPIISLLQSAPTTQGITITQTLTSNPMMRGLLSDQLKQWVETAKDDFGVLLGFPKKWKSASKNVLHPVERATARFQCIRCGVKAKRGSRTDDGCLDFEAACRHVCSVGRGKILKGKKGQWDVSNFAKDEKAINALNKIIQTLGYSEDKDGARIMIALGLAVLCTSCDPPMILDSRSVAGHCHRHEAMELSLTFSVDTITSYLGGYPFTFGLTERLLGPEGLSIKGKKAIGSKNYGCRHCLRVKQVGPAAVAPDVAAENEGDGSDAVSEEAGEGNEPLNAVQIQLSTIVCRMHDRGIQGPKERPPPLFNFNGMVSHLKAKHRIERIRDEDFLCYGTVDL